MSAPSSDDSAASRARMLVVDDDPQVARLAARVAEMSGFAVTVATRAEEARAALAPEPRLLLLDLNMPEVDGLEMLRELAALGCRSRVHVFSGADLRVVRTAERLGVELGLRMGPALTKPIQLDALRDALESARDEGTPATGFAVPILVPARWEPQAADLQEALEQRHLFIVFQPILELDSLQPRGAEVLVRWRHPEHGVVPPIRFVPLAEHAGLALEMTEQIASMAMAVAARPDYSYGGKPLSVSVNLAPAALAVLDMPSRISNLLTLAGLAPDRLVIEVTESAAMANRSSVLEVLSRLNLRGVEISVDDFGTGTSSLERLDQLPCAELKIERAFVSDVLRRPEAAAIVHSTIELGRGLGLRVVAEGIEDPAILRWLREAGCELGQGFLFSRGIGAEEFLAWLGDWPEQRRGLEASLAAG